MEAQRAYKKEEPEQDELKSPDSGETRTPRRALRGRGTTRANPAVLPSSPDTNGAATTRSGRVLRDRSTRSAPLWRRKDLGEEQEEEEEEEEDEAPRRRNAPCPRRKRNQEPATDTTGPSGESRDALGTRAGGSRRAQGRCRPPSSRASRASPRVVCKSEPETESSCAEVKAGAAAAGKKTSGKEKGEGGAGEEDVLLGEEEATFADDPKDQTYDPQPQSEEEEEEGVSSDEDAPFKDDLNDQSYDPKSAREAPKARRRAPGRPRERKEKASVGGEREKQVETEVKTEGGDGGEVKPEVGDGADPPRKRGRRRKDDKSPRLPKRRKKPPVQYVRCEMEGCGTVLAHPRYLQHHIKYQHLMKKKYVCPHPSCGRLFRLQKQLLRHAKHHTDQRDYICEFCARAFKSSHNLAVHRMIHTGEKPLQCEICGFTCRQKASLNWHMKKHDADATYQFSCTICGKKFEKKDSVVAHKAKSHPEVLIAEALAANAGTLVTTATAPAGQVSQVDVNPVVVPEQDRSALAAQAPVADLAPPPFYESGREPERGGATLTQATSSPNQTLQTVHFVSAPASQQQQQPVQASPQIVHMTFAALNPPHQLPLLSVTHQLPVATSSPSSVSLHPPVSASLPPLPPHPEDLKAARSLWDGGNGNMGGVWEAGGANMAQVVTDSSEEQIQRVLI